MSDGAAFCERHVWSMHGMFQSVSQMLEQLSWIPLSKIRKNSRLILLYKVINNLAVEPHSCLENADVRNRKTFSTVSTDRLRLQHLSVWTIFFF